MCEQKNAQQSDTYITTYTHTYIHNIQVGILVHHGVYAFFFIKTTDFTFSMLTMFSHFFIHIQYIYTHICVHLSWVTCSVVGLLEGNNFHFQTIIHSVGVDMHALEQYIVFVTRWGYTLARIYMFVGTPYTHLSTTGNSWAQQIDRQLQSSRAGAKHYLSSGCTDWCNWKRFMSPQTEGSILVSSVAYSPLYCCVLFPSVSPSRSLHQLT